MSAWTDAGGLWCEGFETTEGYSVLGVDEGRLWLGVAGGPGESGRVWLDYAMDHSISTCSAANLGVMLEVVRGAWGDDCCYLVPLTHDRWTLRVPSRGLSFKARSEDKALADAYKAAIESKP